MDKYYIVVAGNGATSRANVEALIEDYVYAHGPDVTFIFSYEDAPSQGQVFISQWAKDKAKDVIVFANTGAKYDGISSASVVETNKLPLFEACKSLPPKTNAVGFVLWGKEDNDFTILDTLLLHEVVPYNLCEGLEDLRGYWNAQEDDLDEEPEVHIEPEKADIDLEDIIRRVTAAVVAELNAQNQPLKGSRA